MPAKIVYVFPDLDSQNHWMVKRMVRRAGLGDDVVKSLTCTPDLLAQLSACTPKVVVAFGETSLDFLIGKADILRWFNRVVTLPLKDCTPWVVPCLDPKLLLPRRSEETEGGKKKKALRAPTRYQGAVTDCLRKAHKIAVDGAPWVQPTSYLEDPSPKEFATYVGDLLSLGPNSAPLLSWDIETPYKMKESDEEEFDEGERKLETQILRISFSHTVGTAVSIPWEADYLPHIKRLLEDYQGVHIGHNCLQFDIPIVEANGIDLSAATFIDGMDAFHLWQTDEDKGLEYVSGRCNTGLLPWKHLSDSEPALYSCIDADAALRNTLYVLGKLTHLGLRERLDREMHVMRVLARAGKRGNYVNDAFRLKFKGELEVELLQLLKDAQGLVEDRFIRRKYYARKPKEGEWQEKLLPRKKSFCSLCHKQGVSVKHKCPNGEAWTKVSRIVAVPHFFQRRDIGGITGIDEMGDYLYHSGFNPCSSYQLLSYMRVHKHPVGTNHKTKEDTADVKHIKKLVKRYGQTHPIYAQTLKIRLLQKALSTYVNGLAPDATNRVHCVYVNSPSTWRLGGRNFNPQNLGKRDTNPYARDARKIIVPSPGCTLVEADSSSIEAVFSGYFMQHLDGGKYLDVARKGVHAWLCCKKLGIPFTPEAAETIKKDHKELYNQLKRVVHGCLTGDHEVLTPFGWVRFDQYNVTTPLAQWHPETKEISWCVPKDYVNKPVAETLIHLKGTRADFMATADHRWAVNTSQGNVKEYRTCTLPKANTLPTVGWLGEGKVVDPVEIKRIVAIQADGTLTGKKSTFHLRKARKVTRLLELGGQAKGTSEYYTLPLPAFGLTANKLFDATEILSWDLRAREIFINELPKWDGDNARVYRSSLKENVDVVVAVAHVTGYSPTVNYRPPTPSSFGDLGYWEVKFSFTKGNKNIALESLERTEVPYTGQIYCVTTDTGYFLVRRNDKVAITGNTSYGMGPYLMHMNEPEIFPTLTDAKVAQNFLFKEMPGLQKWHRELQLFAQKNGYLESPWKVRHHFYDVFTYKHDEDGNLITDSSGEPKIVLGKDGKRAIAFKPQNSAAMFMRDNLLLLADTPAKAWMCAVVSIHDSLCLDVPTPRVEEAKEMLVNILTRPIPECNGLKVGCDVGQSESFEQGGNFKDMKSVLKIEV